MFQKSLVFILIVCNTIFLHSQSHFPDTWTGHYEGTLEIFTVDSVAMKLTMKLDVQPVVKDSVYQWKMTYIFKGNEDIRDYELKIQDAKRGKYSIDEKNSILLDGYYRNGVFSSFFKVEDSFIISEYHKVDDVVYFDIIAATDKPISSGNQTVNEEAIPEVLSYPVNGRQKAVLYKTE